MPMPEELEAVFDSDPIAFKFFEKLTPGKQRSLLHLVGKVKRESSRIAKSLAIADHLVSFNGQLDYKALNERIKHYNQLNASGSI
jgi:uncharacterized protein YdeI (YjbR/CyaY-like superfamily)